MPYDHKNTTPNGASAHLMRTVLENLNHRHFQDSCLVGSGGGAVGYLAHGTTTDYMYDIVKVPMPFTFEIYGDEKASTSDCFKMFNPVDKTTFDVHKSSISISIFIFWKTCSCILLELCLWFNISFVVASESLISGAWPSLYFLRKDCETCVKLN